MILRTVRIKNFKCITDTTEFSIDPRVTCLVGKNESGKTAILQAIEKLRPVDEGRADFVPIDEYPRSRWVQFRQNPTAEVSECLSTCWDVTEAEREELRALIGPAADSIGRVTVTKGYDNEEYFNVEFDEEPVVEYLLQAHQLLDGEREPLASCRKVEDVARALAAVADQTNRQKVLASFIETQLQAGDVGQAIIDKLTLPTICYFSEYHHMPGKVSVTDLKGRIANKNLEGKHRVFMSLLDMIGRTVEDLEKITQHEQLRAELEAASVQLTRDVFQYWSQNAKLRVLFTFDPGLVGDPAPFNAGWVIHARIENMRHGASTPFDQRSAGFVWFFSFLVWFGQIQKQYGKDLIILLDEPGLTLHATAQHDLLRYIEEQLAPHYQVIYTAHSPFMIDPANILRARTVEDVVQVDGGREIELGTKVGDDVLSTDRETLFPLQACLGYEITQTLFVGKHTVLVEGPSEILYFEWFRRKLENLGRTTLDRRWTITPCSGIDKIPAFLSLFSGNRLHIAVVTDFATGDKRKVDAVRRSKLLQDGHVLTMDSYAGQEEADIEDLVGRKLYEALVRGAYGLKASQWRLAARRKADVPVRLVKEVELKLPADVTGFDHYHPAEWLMRQGVAYEHDGLAEALDRFELLFSDLNAMLS